RGPEGQLVAVKLLRQARTNAGMRFEREARLHAALGAEAGFVPLLASGESPHGSYTVMPLLPGGTLAEKLRRGRLPSGSAVALVGSRHAPPAADVFALGALLHECLTGEPAFPGATATEVLVAIAEGRRRPLRAVSKDIPRWLEGVVARATAKDLAARFPDGAAL